MEITEELEEIGASPAPVAIRITTARTSKAVRSSTTPTTAEAGATARKTCPGGEPRRLDFPPIAENKQITLTVDVPAAGLLAVCDEVRIQRVIENLLSNAIRHSPAAGPLPSPRAPKMASCACGWMTKVRV